MSTTCRTAKLQVIFGLHVSVRVLEHPLATGEYVGLTGFYIRASEVIRGRNEACEPLRWNSSVHVVGLRSKLKKLTVAATHTTSWKPPRPPTECAVSPDASGAVCKGIPEVPFWPGLHSPTDDLGRKGFLCFVVLFVFLQIWITSPLGSRLTLWRWTCLGTGSDTWGPSSSWCPKTWSCSTSAATACSK